MRPGLATQQDLLRWADSVIAQTEFPRLIRRLILETGRGVIQLGFPAGEGTAVGSWDGTVRANEGAPFIPLGLSLWELSVQDAVTTKADKDYDKRTTTPDGTPTQDATYVAASLRRFAKKADWAQEHASRGRWNQVRAYGVDEVEAWLETAPVTHFWISEVLNLHPTGLTPAESWWKAWATQTAPALTPGVVSAGRGEAMTRLAARLRGHPQVTTVKAGSLDDVLSLIWASSQPGVVGDSGSVTTRTAWIDDAATWRALAEHQQPLVIVPLSDSLAQEMIAASHHHVVVPVFGSVNADIELPPLDSQLVLAALKSSGLDERVAEDAGRIARMSLVAMRRRLAVKPELHQPTWAKPPVGRTVRLMLLAGRWNENSEGDRNMISELFGVNYESLADEFSARLTQDDPLLARTASALGIVSPYDAWLQLRGELTNGDLERFESTAVAVLAELDHQFALPLADQWRAQPLGAVLMHSRDMRAGLAGTLALLGGQGPNRIAASSFCGQNWADRILRQILDRANDEQNGHLWSSLGDVLPLLAEAAPDVFLEAVRAGLKGDSPVIGNMFVSGDRGVVFGPTSPHIHLLWALESCAWSPDHFGQAIELLARLAEVDPTPNSNSGNRPFKSLEDIFCPWHPNNSVGVQRRFAVLDSLRQRHPQVSWCLLLAQLPQTYMVSSPTYTPSYRDWKPRQESVMMKEYFDFVDAIVDLLLNDADTRVDRWIDLLDVFDALPPISREKVELVLKSAPDRFVSDDDRAAIWEHLRSKIAHHREFSGVDWALPPTELDQLETVATSLQPQAPSARYAWLFSDQFPELPEVHRTGNWGTYQAALQETRTSAAAEIAEHSSSFEDINEYAKSLKFVYAFGDALGRDPATRYEPRVIELLESGDRREVDLATGYLTAVFEGRGWHWLDGQLQTGTLSAQQQARLLRVTRDWPKAWFVAERLGPAVVLAFWREFPIFGLGEFAHVEFVSHRLLEVGREAAALEFLQIYGRGGQIEQQARAELIATALERLGQRTTPDPEFGALTHNNLADRLRNLRSAGMPEDRIAGLEWIFLPLLRFDARPVALGRRLATDPLFFAEVVALVYRPKGGEDAEETSAGANPGADANLGDAADQRERRARIAFTLLWEWRSVPGLRDDGSLDGHTLQAWITRARERLQELDRMQVGEQHIGQVLAWSSVDTHGEWPQEPVRDLLEQLQSDDVEAGLRIGLHNKRGVTSRSLFEGGIRERDLSTSLREQAAKFADQWPRTSAILRSLADSYEFEGRRHDDDSERTHRGLR